MVEIKVVGDKAVFEVEGWDKLWTLRSRLEIPLKHIRGVHADPKPAMGWFDGIKLGGPAIPHIFRAGTPGSQKKLIIVLRMVYIITHCVALHLRREKRRQQVSQLRGFGVDLARAVKNKS